MLYRLRNDFRLSIMTMLGACAFVGITPFAVYRFIQGDLRSGLVDVAILGLILITVTYAWVSGRTGYSGIILAIVACAGACVVAVMQGDNGIFWLFPTLITSFFLTRPLVAVLINSCAILTLVLQDTVFDSAEQLGSFIASGMVVSACAYVFALRNENQRKQLEQLAIFDFLTGAKNRRAMDQSLQVAAAEHARTGVPQGLVMLDLDHFKRVNDVHGHTVGDEILVQCAQLVSANIRQADQLFRFGGEEFVLLLNGVQEDKLAAIALNLRRQLATNLRGPDGPITASFGAAMLKPQETWESWLDRADAALYQAKHGGRDCVVLANGDPSPQR
ncbi:GGDEF domain-containing protein [Hydrocarboniclastica marina]|uniref:diguanylate cyclase n=1 Tax=Hydrocarboniclastica marina TaxID=2259620 RepID=A0A4P7XCH0_9ALTE|nr:GGDEF domain-containing protein [Hydrocarboniclastica marina]MAL97940.1 GGDEF domain-containing protein [Alteromonadaceae bacterium]QCF24539.1 GGDEF domain-containing protein [Hydrocarboniclastica marina]|tara:strand:+ start:883 stop:1878 length:996 start_codon:yes stop_codon:yes gene_type:complete